MNLRWGVGRDVHRFATVRSIEEYATIKDVTARRYWQWTAKVNGKTGNRRLTQPQAEIYQDWIDNDRRQRAIIARSRESLLFDGV